MRQEPITFACMTKPHLDRMKAMLPKVIPFVDRAVIVIGERNKEAEEYIKSFGTKINLVYRAWDDSFAAQWNVYLHYVSEGWVLVLDDDEVPSDNMLNSLDGYINDSARGEKYCCIGFRCNPISEGQDMGPCDYYRHIFFRYQPQMKYVSADSSGCHQCLAGYQNSNMLHSKDNEVYYHIKSLKDEYRNASRNAYIYGIWLNDADIQRREEWHELRRIVSETYPEVQSFPDLDKIFIAGNIKKELKDWMIKWHNLLQEGSSYFDSNPEYEYWHYNEIRPIIKYYLHFLHPEECPEEVVL